VKPPLEQGPNSADFILYESVEIRSDGNKYAVFMGVSSSLRKGEQNFIRYLEFPIHYSVNLLYYALGFGFAYVRGPTEVKCDPYTEFIHDRDEARVNYQPLCPEMD